MSTADMLRRAKDQLLAHGWTQHKLTTARGEICLSQAFRSVLGIDGYFSAYPELTRALGVVSIPAWNDEPLRTPEQVLGLLENAIWRAEMDEQARPAREAASALVRV